MSEYNVIKGVYHIFRSYNVKFFVLIRKINIGSVVSNNLANLRYFKSISGLI